MYVVDSRFRQHSDTEKNLFHRIFSFLQKKRNLFQWIFVVLRYLGTRCKNTLTTYNFDRIGLGEIIFRFEEKLNVIV